MWIFCCAFAPHYGGQHDFDFEFGSWTAHLTVLKHPLSGPAIREAYDGTSIVHKLLGGRENIGELQVRGPAGSIDGLTIRLYDQHARQWRIYWANARNPSIEDSPMIGGFSNGRGVFYGHGTLGGRPIDVRFVFSDISRDRFRFEQAFSPDGGKTWEVNWIATFDRCAKARGCRVAIGTRELN